MRESCTNFNILIVCVSLSYLSELLTSQPCGCPIVPLVSIDISLS